MIALGFLTASWAATRLCKRRGIDTDSMLNGALVSFIGGILGARLYFVALNWRAFSTRPEEILATWLGGLSIHGGMLGGLLSGFAYAKLAKKPPFLHGIDIAGTILPLAQGIGRWGNFFNSEAFGKPVTEDFPLRLYIPQNNRPPQYMDANFFHATFLYECIWDVALFALLYNFAFDRLRRYPGMTFLLYIFAYSIGRALIEPMRTDSIMVNGQAAPSVVSHALIVSSSLAMAGLFAYYRKHPAQEPPIAEGATNHQTDSAQDAAKSTANDQESHLQSTEPGDNAPES